MNRKLFSDEHENLELARERTVPARTAALNVLVIVGHPRKDSLCGALATAFATGAREARVQVRELWLADLDFDLCVRSASPTDQSETDDIGNAQKMIWWADHLVFVYPNWWGTMPALMKGFLDRTLTPGFAFADREDGGRDKMLKGKTAQLLTTMDMHPWVYRLIFRQPGNNAMKRSALGFCGVRTTRILNLGPVKDSTAGQRRRWLKAAKQEGLRLQQGVLTGGQKVLDKTIAWLTALRLHFYPLTWVAYTVGALGANLKGGNFDLSSYWLGYAVLFFLEVATVLSNEFFDFETDRHNRNFGPFTGGSRILVDKLLSFREVKGGATVALFLALGVAAVAVWQSAGATEPLMAVLAIMFIIAPGYTAPPLKLVYRGLGEFDVGITHSIGVLMCGYLLQGGAWSDSYPWLVGLPLFFAILPAIILSSLPDLTADTAASKYTLSVILGPQRAVYLAIAFTLAAAFSALAVSQADGVRILFGTWIYGALAHAALLSGLLIAYARRYQRPGRIDGLMVAALSYTVWFCASPLIALI